MTCKEKGDGGYEGETMGRGRGEELQGEAAGGGCGGDQYPEPTPSASLTRHSTLEEHVTYSA